MATGGEIVILLQGYSYMDEKGNYHASGSSTLVKKGNINIVVDTGGPWDGGIIKEGLLKANVTPEDVNYVIGTHGHSDHIGNLNYFPNAMMIVGFDICRNDIYLDNELKQGQKYVLVDGVLEVIPTPGHTHSDVSLIVYDVKDYGTVAVAGDLFESKNDEGIWQPLSEDVAMQEKNRKIVLSMADYIIPGHGEMFRVVKE